MFPGHVYVSSRSHRLGRDTIDHLAELPGVPADEDVDQNRNVLAPVHERGHGDLVPGEQAKQRTQPRPLCASWVRLRVVEAITRTSGTVASPRARARS